MSDAFAGSSAVHLAPWLLIGYLLGSIPFGLLLTSAAGLGDIRAIGSGNIGATNVLRTGRRGLAAATLVLDSLKGAAAVLLAARWGGEAAALTAGLASVVGHMFPVWLRFRGGKGVATGLGVLLAADIRVGLVSCAVWLITARLTKFSSGGALAAYVAAPLVALALGRGGLALVAVILAALVFWRHHANIRRLIAGTEPRIGQAK